MLTASRSVKSFRSLRETVEYAFLDAELWLLLQDATRREELRQALLHRYFPQTRIRYQPAAGTQAVQAIRQQMLEEPVAEYRRHVAPADELDTAVRSGLFKRVVLEAYDHTCAISGLKLLSTHGAVAPLLDACHIVPWAVSHDDTLPNELALTPTLHRAFDRHLLVIDEDYRVRLADGFRELGGTAYGISQFEGQRLRLPARQEWWPRPEGFKQRTQY